METPGNVTLDRTYSINVVDRLKEHSSPPGGDDFRESEAILKWQLKK